MQASCPREQNLRGLSGKPCTLQAGRRRARAGTRGRAGARQLRGPQSRTTARGDGARRPPARRRRAHGALGVGRRRASPLLHWATSESHKMEEGRESPLESVSARGPRSAGCRRASCPAPGALRRSASRPPRLGPRPGCSRSLPRSPGAGAGPGRPAPAALPSRARGRSPHPPARSPERRPARRGHVARAGQSARACGSSPAPPGRGLAPRPGRVQRTRRSERVGGGTRCGSGFAPGVAGREGSGGEGGGSGPRGASLRPATPPPPRALPDLLFLRRTRPWKAESRGCATRSRPAGRAP